MAAGKRKSLLGRLRRRLQGSKPSVVELPRVSSFPFISGDTFRLMAGTEFLRGEISRRSGLPEHVAFVDGDIAAKADFFSTYSGWAASLENYKPTLIIHNSDLIPDASQLARLAQFSSEVFCVNVVDEQDGVVAIPIGLENAFRNQNGRLSLYLDGYREGMDLRNRRVLSSFHVETNPSVRGPARTLMENSRFGYQGFQWKLGEYRAELRQTRFVICPPGNGTDTHRTWEAIYLGAIPVVLRSALAVGFQDLPILFVDSYENFLEMSDEELDIKFEELSMKSRDMAFFPYWAERVMRASAPQDSVQ